jgi:hypothetical protein
MGVVTRGGRLMFETKRNRSVTEHNGGGDLGCGVKFVFLWLRSYIWPSGWRIFPLDSLTILMGLASRSRRHTFVLWNLSQEWKWEELWRAGALITMISCLFRERCVIFLPLDLISLQEIFVQVVISRDFGCGITLDQRVKCWGKSAREVSGLYSQITASEIFMCGVLVDGRINCWGMYKFPLPQPGASKFVQISCGATQCCTLDSQGKQCIQFSNFLALLISQELLLAGDGEPLGRN